MNTPTNQTKQQFLTIIDIGKGNPGFVNGKGRNPAYQFIYIQKGEGWLSTKNGRERLGDNCVFWIYQRYDNEMEVSGSTVGFCIDVNVGLQNAVHYDPKLIYHPQFLQLITASGGMKLSEETGDLINLLLQTMMKEANANDLFGQEITNRYLKIFLVHLLRELNVFAQNMNAVGQTEIVQRFQAMLEKNFITKKLVTDYAALLGLTPNYLNIIIKKLTGYPASYHIKQRIALEAKRLGAYTDLCMKQVAYDLGFDDIPHFSKYFKSATGMNFTDFKQERHLALAG